LPTIIVVTGFAPFAGERINPSWEVARRLDGDRIGGLQVKSVRLPVNCVRAALRVRAAIVRYRPRALLGLGQARGRPALSLERIAINLFQQRNGGQLDARNQGRAVVRDGPAGYFSRLPIAQILTALEKRKIPASISLSAGVFACNAAMYAALHALRDRPHLPAGFIHLPFDAAQAARAPAVASMPVDLMEQAIRAAIVEIAREALRHPDRARVRAAAPAT
jgi:pyroglutamyl-peptidase